jgi:hypothetical protein
VSKLSIIFGDILSRDHGNSEQQNGALEPSIILNYFIIYYCKIITETEKTK